MRRSKQIIIALSSAASLLAMSAPVMADTAASVEVHSLTAPNVYYSDFDVQALDFDLIVPANDVLQTLTIVKNGTARENIEYTNLKLWADEGPAGFQGWGIDKQVGAVTFEDSVWVVKNINYAVSGSHRFFATIESGQLIDEKIAQFALQPAQDNGDGVWQPGERGIFLGSHAIVSVPDGAYSTTLRFKSLKADTLPPKGYISSLPRSATVSTFVMPQTDGAVEFAGEARDRNGGTVDAVSLTLNGQPLTAVNTGTNFSSWSATYYPTKSQENLTIVLHVTDGSGKSWDSVPYYVSLDAREPSFEATTVSVSKNTINADGMDAAEIAVILNDDSFEALANRPVRFNLLRDHDHIDQVNVTTNEFGVARVTLTSTEPGHAVVQIYSGDTIVGGVAILVNEPQPTPSEPTTPSAPEGLQKGDLIKGSLSAVYYFDGVKRHVFVNQEVYASWYGTDFSKVKTVSDTTLASIALGRSVGFRPGTLIKTPSIPNVYVVDRHQTLRHVTSEQVAGQIFGKLWNKQIHDLAESLLTTYQFGDDIIIPLDYNQEAVVTQNLTISDEL